tara:strand:+ start:510 stop:716 length:207 start_codon:yes stop_codon:yes gene_type:complete
MSKKQNAEEDYITTPISVLSYITELELKTEQLKTDKIYDNGKIYWMADKIRKLEEDIQVEQTKRLDFI